MVLVRMVRFGQMTAKFRIARAAARYSTSPAMTNPSTVNVATTAQALNVTGLNRNTTYYFLVRTTNVSGQSLSNVVSVTTRP